MRIYSNEFIDTCSNITPELLPFLSDVRTLASLNDASPVLRTAVNAALNSPMCKTSFVTLESRESLQVISHPLVVKLLSQALRIQINSHDFEYVCIFRNSSYESSLAI